MRISYQKPWRLGRTATFKSAERKQLSTRIPYPEKILGMKVTKTFSGKAKLREFVFS